MGDESFIVKLSLSLIAFYAQIWNNSSPSGSL